MEQIAGDGTKVGVEHGDGLGDGGAGEAQAWVRVVDRERAPPPSRAMSYNR